MGDAADGDQNTDKQYRYTERHSARLTYIRPLTYITQPAKCAIVDIDRHPSTRTELQPTGKNYLPGPTGGLILAT
jgi:hypothetical protein